VIPRRPSGEAALYALDSGNPARLALPAGSWDRIGREHRPPPRQPGLRRPRFRARRRQQHQASWCATSPGRWSCGRRPAAAAALYAGISFDTGHFHHDNTSAQTFRTAAWLVELGVDVTALYGPAL